MGIVNVVDDNKLCGVFTDGDLRRALSKGIDVYNAQIDDYMITDPIVISPDALAVEALKIMSEKNISALPVMENGKLAGKIIINDITCVGIII